VQRREPQTLCESSKNNVEVYRAESRIAIKIDQGINGTSLIKFRKDVGDDMAKLFLADMIIKQASFFNLVDTIKDEQAAEIAELLVNEYPYTTVADLTVMFRYAKTGKPGYEKPMSRLDGRIIFNWLNLYLDEKIMRIEELNRIESDSHKNEPISDKGIEVLTEITKKFEAKLAKEREAEKAKRDNALITSHEKQTRFIKENIEHFSKRDVEGMIKQFKGYMNMGNHYTEIIEFLENELNTR